MTNINEALLYGVADILQVPLRVVGKGYKSAEPRMVKIGPWEFSHTLQVKSDVLDKDLASFWVRISGDLWIYAISFNNGNSVKLIVFSAAAAKINKGLLALPCSDGNLKASLELVKAAGGLAFTFKNDQWVSCPVEF